MLLSLLTAFFALAALGTSQNVSSPAEPTAPALEFLYTAYFDCLNSIYESNGPKGIRGAIPIVAGNFTGPRLSGQFLNFGADWGTTDPRTGIFSPDTRYNLKTDDGAYLYLQTNGPGVPAGGSHVRVTIETGDERYYWLNNVLAVGVTSRVASNETGFTIREDVWHVAGEYNNTTFVNRTSCACD